jgi:hypothetical protein
MVESGCADDFCAKKIDHTAGKVKPKPIKASALKEKEEPVVEQKKAPNIVRKISW